MNRLLIILAFISLIGCRKNLTTPEYTISGRLLESSSNLIPVRNYQLQISQPDDYGLLGGVGGLTKDFRTDGNGFFSLVYTPEKSTGLVSGGANSYSFSITGIDTALYRNLFPYWYPVTANKDTNLDNIYLFKKIEKLVRKVQFNQALGSNDSLELITSAAYGANYKTLYGPIPAGTLLVADTINQFKTERFSITYGSYYLTSTLKKTSYQSDFNLKLPAGDETYREQLLVYP
ncbi:MAG: hypothetical protein Q8941_07115 [Bacteroidota bacterium]|nr:hypothetical protein [Bacteroidota bacterium]